MSKLSIIRQVLKTNPGVVIVDVKDHTSLPNICGAYCHFVDYRVAPKNGLYTLDELQEFMVGLVPNLQPTIQIDFRQHSRLYDENTYLEFGSLLFEEKVGEARRVTKRVLTLTDEELLSFNGNETIEKDATEVYKRGIYVHPFPDESFVKRDPLETGLGICNLRLD
ncbi:MAG: hypothetical protein ABIH25_02480 [Candidatus Woesearchaeota archaeon]